MIQKILSVFILSLFVAAVAHADVIVTKPIGVVGPYRLAFVSSGTRDASSFNIADYDAFVQAAADAVTELADLGLTWQAIAAVEGGQSVRDHTGTNKNVATGVPIYLLDGTLLATNNEDFWDGTLATPLSFTELGTTLNTTVWTGSMDSGFGGRALGNPTYSMHYGDSSLTTKWLGKLTAVVGSGDRSIYAISGVIGAVPEPNSMVLLLGLAGLGGICARRRKQAKPSSDS